MKRRKRTFARQLLRGAFTLAALVFAGVVYLWMTLPDVRVLTSENPTTTAFWELREQEARDAGRVPRFVHAWVPLDAVSEDLRRAVVVAEDDAFYQHEGVDYAQLRLAFEDTLTRGEPLRGASTITQQLAKNLYLSPSRSPLRKFQELLIARRLEAELSKARILEIYLNVIEWGDGLWGAEAAALAYFGVPASRLTREQSALLAGAVAGPGLYNPANPGPALWARQQRILQRMRPGARPASD